MFLASVERKIVGQQTEGRAIWSAMPWLRKTTSSSLHSKTPFALTMSRKSSFGHFPGIFGHAFAQCSGFLWLTGKKHCFISSKVDCACSAWWCQLYLPCSSWLLYQVKPFYYDLSILSSLFSSVICDISAVNYHTIMFFFLCTQLDQFIIFYQCPELPITISPGQSTEKVWEKQLSPICLSYSTPIFCATEILQPTEVDILIFAGWLKMANHTINTSGGRWSWSIKRLSNAEIVSHCKIFMQEVFDAKAL